MTVKKLITTFPIIVAVIISIFIGFIIYFLSPRQISNQYENTITVDKLEKVPMAISNAVHDVSSRNFVVVHLSVSVNQQAKRTFTVKCGGIDSVKLISLDD